VRSGGRWAKRTVQEECSRRLVWHRQTRSLLMRLGLPPRHRAALVNGRYVEGPRSRQTQGTRLRRRGIGDICPAASAHACRISAERLGVGVDVCACVRKRSRGEREWRGTAKNWSQSDRAYASAVEGSKGIEREGEPRAVCGQVSGKHGYFDPRGNGVLPCQLLIPCQLPETVGSSHRPPERSPLV
jgi:hypothetical protein